jgi:hypothetical protein
LKKDFIGQDQNTVITSPLSNNHHRRGVPRGAPILF